MKMMIEVRDLLLSNINIYQVAILLLCQKHHTLTFARDECSVARPWETTMKQQDALVEKYILMYSSLER